MNPPDFGININGKGEPVGLWFGMGRVWCDEHAYVDLTIPELQLLAGKIVGEVSKSKGS